MKAELGQCSIAECPNRADRNTAHGPLCPAHRKRLQPSRAGGKKLFESVAKREEFLVRWRKVSLSYGNADTDEEFDAAERDLMSLLQMVAGDGTVEVAQATNALAEARSLAMRRGHARRRAAGLPIGRPRTYTDEQIAAALVQTTTHMAAAELLGCPPSTVHRAVLRNSALSQNQPRHNAGVPPREQSSAEGEPDAVAEGQVESRVQPQRERADEERAPSEAGAGDRLPRKG